MIADWTIRINELRQLASDDYSSATCTVKEYIALNPTDGVADYVDALAETNGRDTLPFGEWQVYRNQLMDLAWKDL